jgi:hypothetical protein
MKGRYPEIKDSNITEGGVLKLLEQLNPYKTAGPDNISPRVLKELADHVAPILTIIYNYSYQIGEIPAAWRSASVCPIFKTGKRFEVVKYRPVSLTYIACKIMEHILTSHIMTHAENNRILNPLQHGLDEDCHVRPNSWNS